MKALTRTIPNDARRLGATTLMTALLLSGCGGGGGGGGGDSAPAPPPPLTWYLVLAPTMTVDGQTVTPVDVISHRPSDGTTEMPFSISATPAAIDAFERMSDSRYYFSLDQHADLNGAVAAPGDVILYDSGTYSLALDASVAGIADGVNVDAVTVAGNGDLIFSTNVGFTGSGTAFGDADLVRYDGSTFSLYLSAAALGLDDGADVDGVTLQGGDSLALTTRTGGAANGQAYGNGDVLLATTADGITGTDLDTESDLSVRADISALSDNR